MADRKMDDRKMNLLESTEKKKSFSAEIARGLAEIVEKRSAISASPLGIYALTAPFFYVDSKRFIFLSFIFLSGITHVVLRRLRQKDQGQKNAVSRRLGV